MALSVITKGFITLYALSLFVLFPTLLLSQNILFITIILVAGNPCRPNPCENGGTCNPGHGGKLFECMCREGFTGDKCLGKFTVNVHYSA